MLTDTHAHLYWDSFKKDFDEVIKRALDAGITTIINVGVDVELSKKALEQVRQFHGEYSQTIKFYSTIGIHPHTAYKYINNPTALKGDLNALEQIYLSDKDSVVAIGECGLDYYFESDEFYPGISITPTKAKNLQRSLFQAQIELAKKLNLPLIVHCRDDRSKNPENSEAWDEVLNLVGNYPTILHCYSGLPHTTNYILHTTNLFVSFAGNLTYPKNEYLREAVKLIPLERIVIETDCPFLPPQSKRGQRNEPANILEIAEAVASIKGVSLDKVVEKINANVKSLFALRG